MRARLKKPYYILRDTLNGFVNDDCFAMAGSLAYYAIFSLPGLLVIVVAVAGALFGEEAARGELQRQLGHLISSEGAEQIEIILKHAEAPEAPTGLATTLGLIALLFGATGAFAQLQNALNKAWHVEPNPEKGGVRTFLRRRVLSFGMVLGVGFLLLVSLAVSAGIAAFSDYVGGLLRAGAMGILMRTINETLSFTVITLLFAAIFKVMPDARIRWRDVWVGALVTALLFTLGKSVIGAYLGQSGITDAYGAAGSLAVVLVWVYYSALILLLGAEFTQAWARNYGKRIVPAHGAVIVEKQQRRIDEDGHELD